MKFKHSFTSLLFVSVVLMIFVSACKKEEKKITLPTLATIAVSDITQTSAKSGGFISSDGGSQIIAKGVCWSTDHTRQTTIDDNKTIDSINSMYFVSNINGLKASTTYRLRAYATNSEGTAYGSEFIVFSTKNLITEPVFDIDGNRYNTIQIGNQLWMAENLKTTRYADGTEIPYVTNTSEWKTFYQDLSIKAYCWVNNDIKNKDVYGAFYTWGAAIRGISGSVSNPSKIQGVCPNGWHLPSDSEWSEMENYLSLNGHNYDNTFTIGTSKIGKSLSATNGWPSSTRKGAVGNNDYIEYINKSGFSAFPSGIRGTYGDFKNVDKDAYLWTATEYNYYSAVVRRITYDWAYIDITQDAKESGICVRCLKD